MKFLRIRIEPTSITYLICVHCGKFHTDFAIVSPGAHDDTEPQAGIHRACIAKIHAKRGSS